jgi:mycoredoxin-dependent peroxiredoxin
MAFAVGLPAPDFSLPNQHGETVTLSSFAGIKDVLLVFYPFAFSGVCTGELSEIRDRYAELSGGQTEIMAVSCDHRYSLRAYAERDGYPFSLLSDYWPHGEVSRAYEIFDEEVGCSGRASFVVDRQGVVRWTVQHPIPQARDLDEYLAVLAGLRAPA